MNAEQQRAAEAFGVTGKVQAKDAERFLGLARSLPVMLQTNGLLATWAFLLRERKDPNKPKNPAAIPLLAAFRKRFLARLEAERYGLLFTGSDPDESFLRIGASSEGPELSGFELRLLTDEALRSAVWLKRAAEALCDGVSAPAAGESKESRA